MAVTVTEGAEVERQEHLDAIQKEAQWISKVVLQYARAAFDVQTIDQAYDAAGIKKDEWVLFEDIAVEKGLVDSKGLSQEAREQLAVADFVRAEDWLGRENRTAWLSQAIQAQINNTSQKGLPANFRKQNTLGIPGTKISSGKIEIEHNHRLKPHLLRGISSNPGLEHKIYRTEPVAFKHINEVVSVCKSATYNVNVPRTTPPELRLLIGAIDRQIKNISSRFKKMVQDAATGLARHAFWLGERVYSVEPSQTQRYTVVEEGENGEEKLETHILDMPVKLVDVQHRDQTTANRWLLDARLSRLAGVEFTYASANYDTVKDRGQGRQREDDHFVIIPNGKTPRTARLAHCYIYGAGLNFEGTSPLRVISGLRKLKELLLTSTGVGHQKWNTPLPVIEDDPNRGSSGLNITEFGKGEPKVERQNLQKSLDNRRAQDGRSIYTGGFKVSFVTPSGQLPDPTPLLQYIDLMISLVYSNEGALLGNQASHGSFAQAVVKDNKFLRSSQVYPGEIADMMTGWLHDLIRFNYPDFDQIEEWPEYEFAFEGGQDVKEYAEVIRELMPENDVFTYPNAIRERMAIKLGYPRDVFDMMARETGATTEEAEDETT